MKKNIFFNFLILNIFQLIYTNKIIIPFKTSHNTAINFIESLLYNQIYAQLEVGDNKQNVYLGISTEESLFVIESVEINEFNYDCGKSTSCKKPSNLYIDSVYSKKYIEGDIFNDTFYFYNNFDTQKENIKAYKNIMFGYVTKLGRGFDAYENGYIDNNKNLITGKIGLQITNDYSDMYHVSIIKSLKNLGLIDQLVWSINYTNNEEGYLIIGETPSQYNDSYPEDKRRKTVCTTSPTRGFSWTLSFNDIKIGNNKLNSYRQADYSPQYGLIIGTSEYLDLIKPYFENLGKCELIQITFKQIKYSYYACDTNVDINNFEPIKFIHTDLENDFILNKDDLFMDYNGKKYFLVLFQKESSTQKWSLGKPFVKKYQLVFDHGSRSIYFYENINNENNKSNEESESNTGTIILICVCVFLGVGAITLGIILGKIFVAEKKKKKANELIDEIKNNNGPINTEYNEYNESIE